MAWADFGPSVIQARPCVAVGRQVICRVSQSRFAQEASPSMGGGRGACFAPRSYPMEQRLSRFEASSVLEARPGAVIGRRVMCRVFGSRRLAQEVLPSMGRGCGAGFASRSHPMVQRLSVCRFLASSGSARRRGWASSNTQRISARRGPPAVSRGRGAGFAPRSYPMGHGLGRFSARV